MGSLGRMKLCVSKFARTDPPQVVHSPLSVDDGTLTRTMKPRRPAIFQKYAAEVSELMQKLR